MNGRCPQCDGPSMDNDLCSGECAHWWSVYQQGLENDWPDDAAE